MRISLSFMLGVTAVVVCFAACGGSTGDGVVTSPPPAGDAGANADADGGGPVSVSTPVSVEPAAIAFGKINCGKSATAQSVDIKNAGTGPLSFNATLTAGAASAYAIEPSTGTVAAGTSAKVVIIPKPIPTTSPVPGNYDDTLVVTTDAAGDQPHAVALSLQAQGAILSFKPAVVDFGVVPISTIGKAGFQIANTGNAPATVSLAAGPGSFTVPTGPLLVAGGSVSSVVASFAPMIADDESASVVATAGSTDVLCAPLPAALKLSGSGTNGVVAYTPGALDFQSVDCGATAPPKTIEFSNAGNQSYTVSPALGRGASSPYTVTLSPPTGVVAASGGKLTLTVTPKAVPQTSAVPGDYGDTLTVSTGVVGDEPHSIALSQSAQGAILTLSTNSIAFGTKLVNTSTSFNFSVQNTGNATATLDFTGQAFPTIFTMPKALSAAPGATATAAQFKPTARQAYSDTATITPSGASLCQPLAFGSITLSGTGGP